MARSSLFQKFLAAVNEPVRFTRDSLDHVPDIGAVDLLEGAERAEAERIIRAKLAEGDGRIATALAQARCYWAVPALVEATRTAPPLTRVFAARALLAMGKLLGRPGLVELLRGHEGSGTDRAGAARLLAEFPKPDKELLLTVASTDPDAAARSGAFDALLTVLGLDDEATSRGEVLLSIGGRLLSSLSTVRAEALAELRALLARWETGETADELGLTWHVVEEGPLGRFIEDIDSDRTDFRVEGLSDLTGRERVLLENLVLLRLHADPRAVRAAARLDVLRAAEPLRELLESTRGPAREEIEAALESLTR